MKATFRIAIFKPAGLHAISNEEPEVPVDKHQAGFVRFRPTPRMSSYLVAFVLCPFDYVRCVFIYFAGEARLNASLSLFFLSFFFGWAGLAIRRRAG